MRPYYFPAAERDFERIWLECAEHAGPDVAQTLVERINSTVVKTLQSFPNAGRARPELGPKIRSFPIVPYVVFYETKGRQILVVRVLHGHRDIREPLLSLLVAV